MEAHFERYVCLPGANPVHCSANEQKQKKSVEEESVKVTINLI